jgi:pSer/pThr/pTyr-binding forkhead associated (FHA) protein
MAKLQFSLEGNALGEYELNKERMTIGRRPTNDIHIDNLAVSGEHAAITTIGNDSFLEDMNSTNGTLVNNKTVKKHVLLHNDVIEFGKYQLQYINLTQAKQAAQSGFENTVVMRPAKLNVDSPAASEQPTPNVNQQTSSTADDTAVNHQAASVASIPDASTATEMQAAAAPAAAENTPQIGRLHMLSGANSGRELTLNKALTALGKPGGQLAVINKRPHGYFITHVEGENVPLVNGLRIGLQAHALNNRDVIDMAGTKMEFLLS